MNMNEYNLKCLKDSHPHNYSRILKWLSFEWTTANTEEDLINQKNLIRYPDVTEILSKKPCYYAFRNKCFRRSDYPKQYTNWSNDRIYKDEIYKHNGKTIIALRYKECIYCLNEHVKDFYKPCKLKDNFWNIEIKGTPFEHLIYPKPRDMVCIQCGKKIDTKKKYCSKECMLDSRKKKKINTKIASLNRQIDKLEQQLY